MVDQWSATPPSPQEFPYKGGDGITQMLDVIEKQKRELDEMRSSLLTTAGISVEPNQTSGGYKVGTVRAVNSPLFDATLANVTALAIGDELVAAAQAAIGTPNGTPPYHVRMLVKKATTALGGGQRLKVVAFQSGAGANGSTLTASKIFG